MTDRVLLKDLSLYARHGVFDAEAEIGQRFYIDVEIAAVLSAAESDDNADETIDWAELVEVTTRAFTERRFKLVEAAAAAVAEAVLKRFRRADHVKVEVRKPSAPVEAIFAFSAVVIERTRVAPATGS